MQKVDSQFLDGDALVTDNSDTGEIVLGDFTGRCPHIPSLCENGFSVSFWLRAVKITSKRVAHLVGLGADVAGKSILSQRIEPYGEAATGFEAPLSSILVDRL